MTESVKWEQTTYFLSSPYNFHSLCVLYTLVPHVYISPEETLTSQVTQLQ